MKFTKKDILEITGSIKENNMLKLSPITKGQWISVAKNAIIAGLASFLIVWQSQSNPFGKDALVAGGIALVTAIIKTIEKAFTPA